MIAEDYYSIKKMEISKNASAGLINAKEKYEKSPHCFDYDLEIFNEFAVLCSTQLQHFKCFETTVLKHCMKFVNAAAITNIWLIFENLERLPNLELNILSKEIQMIQQQFIIADLAASSQEVTPNESRYPNQDIAVIERSKDSVKIKKRNSIQEINKLGGKGIFGIFATIKIEGLAKDKNIEGLEGAFRITSLSIIESDTYIEISLRAKLFKYSRDISKEVTKLYGKLKEYKRKLLFRDIRAIVDIAAKIRNNLKFIEKEKANKYFSNLNNINEIQDSPFISYTAEIESVMRAIYLYEKSHMIETNWEIKLLEGLKEIHNSIYNKINDTLRKSMHTPLPQTITKTSQFHLHPERKTWNMFAPPVQLISTPHS